MKLLVAGSNGSGQLAVGHNEDVHEFTLLDDLPVNIKSVAAGSNHTLLLTEHGELWGAGDNSKGQLGPALDSASFRFVRLNIDQVSLVTASWDVSFYVCPDIASGGDTLHSMGGNDHGALGRETGSSTEIAFKHFLPTGAIMIHDINAGPHHVVAAISSRNTPQDVLLTGWGTGRHGRLGRNVTDVVPFPVKLEDTLHLPESISLGHQHTALLTGQQLTIWTSRHKIVMQKMESLENVTAIGSTWSATVAACCTERQFFWSGTMHALPPPARCLVHLPFPSDRHEFRGISCGSEHVLALFAIYGETEVWAWGWNEHGTLGIGTTEDVLQPRCIWRSHQGMQARAVYGGYGTSFILVDQHPV